MSNTRPTTTRSLIGRQQAMARIVEALTRGERLVTVFGPPGVGKTRLVVELIDRIHHGDLALPCDALQFVPAATPSALSRAFGLPPDAHPEDLTALISRQGVVFLVLDPPEPEEQALLPWLQSLLAGAPNAHLIIASRTRTGLPGEHLVEIGPLSQDESLALFLAQVRHVRDLGEAELALAPEIVSKLDGIPLALEVAASRLDMMGATTLLRRLSSGARTLPGLESAIQASWESLDDTEREALRGCALFAGPFLIDAAEHVLAHLDDPLASLKSLRDASLLSTVHSGHITRLRMLRPVRDFAQHQMQAPRDAALTSRHAQWHAQAASRWSEALCGPDGLVSIERLVLAQDDLIAVIERARAHLTRDWTNAALSAARGLRLIHDRVGLERSLSLSQAALALAAQTGAESSVHILAALSATESAQILGRLELARVWGQKALDLARAQDDPTLLSRALANFGRLRRAERRPDEALALYDEARALLPPGAVFLRGSLNQSIALMRLVTGRAGEALPIFLEAVTDLRESGALVYLRIALGNLARARQHLGRPDLAHDNLTEALNIARREQNPRAIAYLLARLAEEEALDDHFDDAHRFLDEALDTLRACGDRIHEADTRCLQAEILSFQDRLTEALDALDASQALLVGKTSPGVEARGAFRRASLIWPPTPQSITLLRAALAAAQRARDHRTSHILTAQIRAAGEDATAPDQPLNEDIARICGLYDLQRPGLEEDLVRALAEWSQPGPPSPTHPEGSPPMRRRTRDARIAVQHAQAWLRRAEPNAEDEGGALMLDTDARRVRPPGGGWIDLHKRAQLWDLIAHLAEHRQQSPGASIPLDALIDALWPGEQMSQGSGRTRVYTAISSLRRKGLRDTLQSSRAGYRLDPDLPVLYIG